MTDPIRPEFELVRDFMPVLLVTSKFDKDPIKNKQTSLGTPFSHYKSMGNFSDAQWHLTLYGLIWPKSEYVRDFMPVLITCKFEKDLIKHSRENMETRFPHYKSMDAFCCHGNQSFDTICPKTLCSLSPALMMLHIKFDQDLANWPQRYSSFI